MLKSSIHCWGAAKILHCKVTEPEKPSCSCDLLVNRSFKRHGRTTTVERIWIIWKDSAKRNAWCQIFLYCPPQGRAKSSSYQWRGGKRKGGHTCGVWGFAKNEWWLNTVLTPWQKWWPNNPLWPFCRFSNELHHLSKSGHGFPRSHTLFSSVVDTVFVWWGNGHSRVYIWSMFVTPSAAIRPKCSSVSLHVLWLDERKECYWWAMLH